MSAGVWTVITVLIVLNALYVAAEFGAVGVRRSRIRRMTDDGNLFAKRLIPFLESPAALDRYVALPPSTLELREKLEQLRALEAGTTTLADSGPTGAGARATAASARPC